MLQLPTSKEHKRSRQGPTMPNTAEMHLKWVKKYGRKNPQWNTKQKLLKKGPKWYGPYEVAERKDGGNGNYLLIPLSGKNKGQVSKKSYPPTTSRGSSTETQRFLMIVILNMDLTMRTVSQLHKGVV